MDMDASYQPLYKQVRNMEFRVHDALDRPQDGDAQSLVREVKRLEDEMEMAKSPRSLEDRIKSIQEMLWQVRSREGGYMSVDDADEFWHIFEDMRRMLRSLPNY
ncbi:MAG TPA: hypothetical protein VHT70_01760 [Candidatus Saccharimonadales bacterium]|jgi:hypothetical protein|nr:hypothetical protein [Candidatus Saccharimonadales bacterium]